MLKKISNKNAKFCIIGLKYVGLPTAIFFAEKGFNVIGVRSNECIQLFL